MQVFAYCVLTFKAGSMNFLIYSYKYCVRASCTMSTRHVKSSDGPGPNRGPVRFAEVRRFEPDLRSWFRIWTD